MENDQRQDEAREQDKTRRPHLYKSQAKVSGVFSMHQRSQGIRPCAVEHNVNTYHVGNLIACRLVLKAVVVVV